jgi:hypothetical protein
MLASNAMVLTLSIVRSIVSTRIASAHASGRGPRNPPSSALLQTAWAQRIVHDGLRSVAPQVTVLIPSRLT